MEPIKCIAVDDEPLALTQLKAYISREPRLELVAACGDVAEARTAMATRSVDLLLLDINMPDVSGMELARTLGDNPPAVIFTTAYSEYAVEGYKVDAVDYLLKPFTAAEFTAAIDRLVKRLGAAAVVTQAEPGSIYVKEESGVRKLQVGDISYIKGLSEYVQIHYAGAKRPVTTLMSMKRMEDLLPPGRFMRVHRSYIINLEHVESIGRMRITLAGVDEPIPVGESYKEALRAHINRLLLK